MKPELFIIKLVDSKMNIKKIYCFLILFLFTNLSYSQSNFIGLRFEPFFFLSNTQGTGPFAYKHKDERGIYLSSFCINYRFKASNIFSMNTRVGYLWTNEDRYNGIEICELLDLRITDYSSIIVGLNLHFNKSDSIREFEIYNVVVPQIVIGTGLKFSKEFQFDILYQYGFNKEYKMSSFNGPVHYKLNGLIKLSLGYEWNL